MMDNYLTLKKESNVEFIEKKSVFIGQSKQVDSVKEAEEFINRIKEKHSSATHNCFAYKVGVNEKYSDDGEPQGTAGIPILSLIKKNNLNNCVIVVTRYFGGILLGASGLVRAYTNSAALAVKESEIYTKQLYYKYKLICSYQQYDRLIQYLKRMNLEPKNNQYMESISFEVLVSSDENDSFKKKILDVYDLLISYERTGESFL